LKRLGFPVLASKKIIESDGAGRVVAPPIHLTYVYH
jgi:hypothetical protein